MSSTVTVRPVKGVRGIGLFAIIAGIVMFIAGIGTWAVTTSQLSAEDITVSKDADFLANRDVIGPFTAYAEAQVINKHIMEMSGGKTYAEMAQNDPKRDTVAEGNFLRASLFTSVIAFGVAFLVTGLGVLVFFLGFALRKMVPKQAMAIESPGLSSGGDLSDASGRRTPAHAAAGSSSASPGDPSSTTSTPRTTTASPGDPAAPGTPPTRPGNPGTPPSV